MVPQRFEVVGDAGERNLHGPVQAVAALAGGQEKAGGQPADVEAEPALRGFVKIVNVVMNLVVVGLVGAEVFAMDVPNQVHLEAAAQEQRHDLTDLVEDIPGVEVKRAPKIGEG